MMQGAMPKSSNPPAHHDHHPASLQLRETGKIIQHETRLQLFVDLPAHPLFGSRSIALEYSVLKLENFRTEMRSPKTQKL